MKRSIIKLLLVGVAFISGCATDYAQQPPAKVAQKTKITESAFEQSIAFVGPTMVTFGEGLFGDTRKTNLRGWQNKVSKTRTHQIYVDISYIGTGWKFFNSASFQGGTEAKTTRITSDVKSCGGGTCHYEEIIGIDVSHVQLETAKDTGLQFKVRAKSGASNIVTIPANYIQGYLLAVNRS